ncbi:MAG: hypothetical protein ACHQ50_13010, partial [Fimbriimonadales bacterium]
PEGFDKADYAWRQVLQSLRTWTGEMPKPEDPTVKIERKDPKAEAHVMVDEVPHPTTPHVISAPPSPKPVKAPAAANLDFGGRKLDICIPSDWSVVSGKDGSFSLHTAGVSGPVNVTVYPVAGSDPASIALVKASAASLNTFTKVSKRDESLPIANRAGASVAAIWRSGIGSKGEQCTCEASGLSGDFYFLLTYRSQSAARWKEERRLIQLLLDRMSVEPGK